MNDRAANYDLTGLFGAVPATAAATDGSADSDSDSSPLDGTGDPVSTVGFSRETLAEFFPEFGEGSAYEEAVIKSAVRQTPFWLSPEGCAHLDGDERVYALCCMAGHLIAMAAKERAAAPGASTASATAPAGSTVASASGVSGAVGGSGLIQSASVGGVSVSMQVPSYYKGSWDWWLSQTPYGQRLLAFLSSRVPVAIYGMGDDLRRCLRD